MAEEMAIVDAARAKTLKALARHRVTASRIAKRLAEALDAMETKATYDKEAGKWVYSDKLIAHSPRLKAIEIAVALLDMKPTEKHDLTVHGEIKALLQEIDGTTIGPPGQRGKKP